MKYLKIILVFNFFIHIIFINLNSYSLSPVSSINSNVKSEINDIIDNNNIDYSFDRIKIDNFLLSIPFNNNRSLDSYIDSNEQLNAMKISNIIPMLDNIYNLIKEIPDSDKILHDFKNHFNECLNVIYRWLLPNHFNNFYMDNCIVKEHGLPHSLDVLLFSIKIIIKEKISFENIDFQTLIYTAIMHDLSQILYRENHHELSAQLLSEILIKDGKISKDKIKKIADTARGHKKTKDMSNNLNKSLESKIIYDADMLCSVSNLERIFNTWKKYSLDTGVDKFYNSKLTILDRVLA